MRAAAQGQRPNVSEHVQCACGSIAHVQVERIKTMEEEDLEADVFSGIPKTHDATVRLARIHENLAIRDFRNVFVPGSPRLEREEQRFKA